MLYYLCFFIIILKSINYTDHISYIVFIFLIIILKLMDHTNHILCIVSVLFITIPKSMNQNNGSKHKVSQKNIPMAP